MSTIVHLSDPHFGTEIPRVEQAVRRVVSSLSPELVVLSGDITQRARKSQFVAAQRFVAALDVPRVVVIAGNHDIPLFNLWARAFSPYRNFRRAFGEELSPSYESDDLLVVCTKTTRRRRHKHGELSRRQIDAVGERLARARPQQLRVVVTHQPLSVTRETDVRNLVRGNEAAIHAWAKAGLDVALGGHIHLPYIQPLMAKYGLERPVWAVQAGTALSHRIREGIPNSLNVIRNAARVRCEVERWDYDAVKAEFAQAGQVELVLDQAGRSDGLASETPRHESWSVSAG
jgi:3',5'-cyclic AMP phosphodiesterase CpdA